MLREVVEELLAGYGELRRSLTAQMRCETDAADIAQSSFEKVYAHALAIAASGNDMRIQSPRALLFHAARNLVIDSYRHSRIEQAWCEEWRRLDCVAAAPSSEHVVAYRQLIERLTEQIARLPERRRAAFLLFRVYGYTRGEIAARLRIKEAAVAKHVLRATLDCARVFADLQRDIKDD